MMKDCETVWCEKCQSSFPIFTDKREELEECGNTFYCPEGHPFVFSQATIAQRLRSKERSLKYAHNRHDRLERALSASIGVRTRMRNRLLGGACPLCTAEPKDLSKHIREKHSPRVA